MSNLPSELEELYRSQQKDWPAFAEAIQNLSQIKSKIIRVEGVDLLVQNNPARIRSTAAKIDAQSLAARPCFLCSKNRPIEQKQLSILGGRYVALVNPFPILPMHFTVVAEDHSKQDIEVSIEDFVRLTSCLDDSSAMIFNGSKAGASAPDHLHFQIVPSAVLPLFKKLRESNELAEQATAAFEFAGAGYLHFCSDSESWLTRNIKQCLGVLKQKSDSQLELINLLAFKVDNLISVVLIPRRSHRPSCFEAEGVNQVVISPAAIELGGIIVLPRFEDFEKINSSILYEVISEVCFGKQECQRLLMQAN